MSERALRAASNQHQTREKNLRQKLMPPIKTTIKNKLKYLLENDSEQYKRNEFIYFTPYLEFGRLIEHTHTCMYIVYSTDCISVRFHDVVYMN
jgi:hypothetical protein